MSFPYCSEPTIRSQQYVAIVPSQTLRNVVAIAVFFVSIGCQRSPAVHPAPDKAFSNLETAFLDPTTKQPTDRLQRGQPQTFRFRLDYVYEPKFVPVLPRLEFWRDGKEELNASLNPGTRNVEKRHIESDSPITLDIPPGKYEVRCVMLMEERATATLYQRSFGKLAVTVE